jgi:hypothetical protein
MLCDSAMASPWRWRRARTATAPCRLALGHAVAHGRHAAGELRHGAGFARGFLDDLETLERLVRRQHVVVGRDDGQRRRLVFLQLQLVVGGEGGEAVGQVGTGQRALRALRAASRRSR